MKYVLYRIKEGKLNRWREWCQKLSTKYANEVLATLYEENLLLEGFNSFRINDDFYALGYQVELEGGEMMVDKNNELNKEHSEVKRECLEFVSKGESDYFVTSFKKYL